MTGATVDAGAVQYVSGEAEYTWLLGYQRVWQDGHVDSTNIFSGGKEVVDGVAVSSFVQGGGLMVVEAGGAANKTGIDTGGTERVLNGGHELDVHCSGVAASVGPRRCQQRWRDRRMADRRQD